MEEIKRIEWIDYSKAFACLLVAIGHLLMSLRSIDNYSYITEFIIWFIYLFHMPLFMCMSGLLYSKNKINSFNDYKKFELKKIINLIVPYITFYSITMILNQLFSSSVNTPKGIKEWLGIFNNPIPPYWFLYALLSIFIIVPIIEKICKNKKSIVLTIFIVLKIVSLFWIPNIYFIKSIMSQGMYFYIGTFISLNKRNDNKICIVSLVITYFLLSMTVYVFEDRISAIILGSIYIVLAVAGMFAFAACNNQTAEATEDTTAAQTEEVAPEATEEQTEATDAEAEATEGVAEENAETQEAAK